LDTPATWTEGSRRPSASPRDLQKNLLTELDLLLACIKEPNSNSCTECGHYISIALPYIALIHNFSVIHKIDLALRPFLFNPPPSPAIVSARDNSH
jgi:hypothetical protein